MVPIPPNFFVFLQSVQKLLSYAVSHNMCTLFTYFTSFALNLTQIKTVRIRSICHCYGNITPQNLPKLLFLHGYAPSNKLCTLLYVSSDSQFNLQRIHCKGLGLTAIAMVTAPQNWQKVLFLHGYASSSNLCTLLICLKQITIKFFTH